MEVIQSGQQTVSHAEVNERLAPRLGMKVKAPTLLRYLRTIPPPPGTPVHVLGLDDFAIRRGDCYGTILINLQTHRPLDLLPDRTADAVLPWLKNHPEIDVVSRDRASSYADAVKRAMPHAIEVADRYHLVQNLRVHLQRFLDRKRTWLPEVEDIPLDGGSTSDQGSGVSLILRRGSFTLVVNPRILWEKHYVASHGSGLGTCDATLSTFRI